MRRSHPTSCGAATPRSIRSRRVHLAAIAQNLRRLAKLVARSFLCTPRSRSRPSLRMRFRWANRIAILLRSCCDRSKPSVPANDRATSHACSWMSRGILRDGSFGQHRGLRGHISQSSLTCAIQKSLALMYGAARPEQLSARQW